MGWLDKVRDKVDSAVERTTGVDLASTKDKWEEVTGLTVPTPWSWTENRDAISESIQTGTSAPNVGMNGSGTRPGQGVVDIAWNDAAAAWGKLGGNEQAFQDLGHYNSAPAGDNGYMTSPKPQEERAIAAEEARQAAAQAEMQAILDSMAKTSTEMTPADRALAAISAEQHNRYVNTFRPLENQVMADVAANQQRAPQVLSAINANLMQKQTGIGGFAGAMGRRTGAMGDAEATGAITLARTSAQGAERGLNALANETAAMGQNVVNLGRGGGDIAASNIGTAARMATQESISDWQYTQGLANLDARASMDNSRLEADRQIGSDQYLASLFSSAAGLAMYGSDEKRDWFSGWRRG